MRPSCLFCARKHLGQAAALLSESRLGYPDHVWLAMGHLAEASDELVADYPAMAARIRGERKHLEEAPFAYAVDVMALIREVSALEGEAPTRVAATVEAIALDSGEMPHPQEGVRARVNEGAQILDRVRNRMAASVQAPPPPAQSLHEHTFMSKEWWRRARQAVFSEQQSTNLFQPLPVRALPLTAPGQALYITHKWPRLAADLAPLLITMQLRSQRLGLQQYLLLPVDPKTRLVIHPMTWNMQLVDATDTTVSEARRAFLEQAIAGPPVAYGITRRLGDEDAKRVDDLLSELGKVKALLDNAQLLPPGMPHCKPPLPELLAPQPEAEPAVASDQPAAAVPPAAPAPVAEQRCVPCEENKRFVALQQQLRGRVTPEGKGVRRIVILTALSDFRPSYSLTSVVLDQARALGALPDTHVQVLIQQSADVSLLPSDLGPNVTVLGLTPRLAWQEDVAEQQQVDTLLAWLTRVLDQIGDAVVITHDLVFQSWFLAWAKAIHAFARAQQEQPSRWRFYHMMHSSVGLRPQGPDVQARCTVPPGHRMVALNRADVPYLAAYYQTDPTNIEVIPNPRDARVVFGMGPLAAGIVSRHRLHLASVVQVYPLSAPRMTAKGLHHVIAVFGALARRLGEPSEPGEGTPEVRLVVLDAHANGQAGQDQRKLMRGHATANGLPAHALVFLSEHVADLKKEGVAGLDDVLAYGADAAAVRQLFQVSNVFVYPTTSEAGPLVLQEAAIAGCLLVLNESLPALRTYVQAENALWASWGSVKQAGLATPDAGTIADRILNVLGTTITERSRREALRRGSLEAYSEMWQVILDGGA